MKRTWVHHYDLGINDQAKERKHPGLPKFRVPIKNRLSKFSFLGVKVSVKQKLIQTFKCHPKVVETGLAQQRSCLQVVDYAVLKCSWLVQVGYEMLGHLLCSPNLVPFYCYLFAKHNKERFGR